MRDLKDFFYECMLFRGDSVCKVLGGVMWLLIGNVVMWLIVLLRWALL
jgi:hypothetical protein